MDSMEVGSLCINDSDVGISHRLGGSDKAKICLFTWNECKPRCHGGLMQERSKGGH